jgi:hypothetical protein
MGDGGVMLTMCTLRYIPSTLSTPLRKMSPKIHIFISFVVAEERKWAELDGSYGLFLLRSVVSLSAYRLTLEIF